MKKNISTIISIFLLSVSLHSNEIMGMRKQKLNSELHNICRPYTYGFTNIGKESEKKAENLISKGADVNLRINGDTPLTLAISGTNLEMVKFLIKKGANPDLLGRFGSPLYLSANVFVSHDPGGQYKKSVFEIFKYLMQQGAKNLKSNYSGRSAIHAASENGHLGIVKLLIQKGISPNKKTTSYEEDTPLHLASQLKNNTEILKYLISKGTNVNAQNKCGIMPLTNAVMRSGFDNVKCLVENGAKIYQKHLHGNQQPLFALVDHQNILPIEEKVKIIKYFLEKLPNFKNEDFRVKGAVGGIKVEDTFLHLASRSANLEIVKILISNKRANPNVKGVLGNTPLHSVSSLPEGWKKARKIETIKYLIQKGANVNLANDIGETPLNIAASKNNIEIVKTLVEYGAKVTDSIISKSKGELRDFLLKAWVDQLAEQKRTEYLIELCQKGAFKSKLGLIKHLFKKEADTNFQDSRNGFTLLHYIAEDKDATNKDIENNITYFIQNKMLEKINLNKMDNNQKNVIDKLQEKENSAAIKLLLNQYYKKNLSDVEECPICRENFNNTEEMRIAVCTHLTHYHCILRWFNYFETCPTCRHTLTEQMLYSIPTN